MYIVFLRYDVLCVLSMKGDLGVSAISDVLRMNRLFRDGRSKRNVILYNKVNGRYVFNPLSLF